MSTVEMQRYEDAVAEESLAWQVYVAALQSEASDDERARLGALARIASNQRNDAAHSLALTVWKDTE